MPGNTPGGMAASRCECTRALGHASPSQRMARSAGGSEQQAGSGHLMWSAPLPRVRASTSPRCMALRRSPRKVPPESGRLQRCTSTCPMWCRCTSGTPTTHRAGRRLHAPSSSGRPAVPRWRRGIGWKVHAVVLVGLGDHAGGCDTHEVHWDVQATRGEVGEPMCRRFVRTAYASPRS